MKDRVTRCPVCGGEKPNRGAVRCRACHLARFNDPEYFWSRVTKTDGCWLWQGNPSGRYGQWNRRDRQTSAHRVAYELTFGAIADGLVIDHLCRNTRCVRPDHLEAVTSQVNVLRGIGPSAVNANAQTCARGHAFDLIDRDGRRRCRRCATARQAKHRAKRADAVSSSVHAAVLVRDRACVLWKRDPMHVCRDQWGNRHNPDDLARLSLEHVKDQPRMGKRAPSDTRHLVALCHGANVAVPSKVERAWMRDYLEGIA